MKTQISRALRLSGMAGLAFMAVTSTIDGMAAATADRAGPVCVVVAVDTSASMPKQGAAALELVRDLVRATLLGSALSVVAFDEEAKEVALTNFLTPAQRDVILQRVQGLQCAGKWTDFSKAVEQIGRSLAALDEPALVVVLSDCIADPPPCVAFKELGPCLDEAFGTRDLMKIVILRPKAAPAPYLSLTSRVEVRCLEDVSAEEILAWMPKPPQAARWENLQEVVETQGREDAAHVFVPASLLFVTAVFGLALRDVRRARRLRDCGQAHRPFSSTADLVVRHGGSTFNFGPAEEVDELRLGGDLACDVRVFSAEQSDSALIVRRRGEHFFLRNDTPSSVEANGAPIAPTKDSRIGLPTTLRFDGGTVTLALVPRKGTKEGNKADSQDTKEVEENEHAERD